MPKRSYRAVLPRHQKGEELRDLLLRIDGVLFHGRPFYDPKDPVERQHLVIARRALADVAYPRGRGGRELPPEAYQAVAALERIYTLELAKPQQERRSQERIVDDYIRTAIYSPLVSAGQLLALWLRERKQAVARK
jgi:hypothetical protein